MPNRKITQDSDPDRNRLRAVLAKPQNTSPERGILEGLSTLHPLVIAIDSDLRLTWLSDKLGLVKSRTEELIGCPVSELVQEIQAGDFDLLTSQLLQLSRKFQQDGTIARLHVELDAPNHRLTLEVSAFRIPNSETPAEIICFADQPQASERQESLERANEELESTLRGVSHDLRSSLVSLLGFTRLLQEDHHNALDPSGQHFVNRIDQAGRHMEHLLNEMLELSRIGETDQCRLQINPTPILQQLSSELKFRLDKKSIELKLPADPPMLHGNRTRLYQIFSNLIGNAIDHMGQRIDGRIVVEIEALPGGRQITVRDNGLGIATGDLERIFGVFETATRSHGQKKSSGLGLTIVKKIVESHSGRVWAESETNGGARFIVWLPTEEAS